MTVTGRRIAAAAAAVLGLGMLPVVGASSATAASADLFFSEYVEGSSYNKAIEIYNGTGAPVDLSTYRVSLYSNGSAVESDGVPLSGSLAAGEVFVLAHGSADPAIQAQADLVDSGVVNWNGDDAIALTRNGDPVDVIGQVGADPGDYWGSADTTTKDHTLRRRAAVTAGDSDGADAFDPAAEWDAYPSNTFDGLGSAGGPAGPDVAPTITSTTPDDGAQGVSTTRSLSVTFSENVLADDGAFGLVCAGEPVPFTLAGSGSSRTVDPDSSLPNSQDCTLTVHADKVVDRDGDADRLAADQMVDFGTAARPKACDTKKYTPAYEIQGDGPTTTLDESVTTAGVVVGDYEDGSSLEGFYLQDLEGDGDGATSDGVFVYQAGDTEVALGDVVRVDGWAEENFGQTQVDAFGSGVVVCGTGGSVDPAQVDLPFADEADRERYEGMLVELTDTMHVTEHYLLGRFGQVTLSSGGRLPQPTNVAEPGEAANAVQDANDLNRIVLDDASQWQNPDPILFARDGAPLSAQNTLRGGDTATGVVGVMTYGWGGAGASPNAYRVRPVGALGGSVDFTAANQRTAAPEPVGGGLRVASFNVLNYFDDFSRCRGGVGSDAGSMDCRGADNRTELDRQAAKIVAALAGLDADVLGVIEIENDGYGPDSALADLVSRLNAKVGADTYRYLDVDARTEQVDALGHDAIKVGMLYKHTEVVPNGSTAVLNTDTFVNGASGEPRNRPALAQTFLDRSTGGRFTLVVNHLKSKGSDCVEDGDPDEHDGQGNCNQTRLDSAQELARWLKHDPTGLPEADVLVMGDLNSYAQEDPVDAIKAAGYTDLVNRFEGDDAYSYVFDGQWGYLDHALASSSLVGQVTGTTTWHINADEPTVLDYNTEFKFDQVDRLFAPTPYRSSDHDPVLVGLDLQAD